MPGPAINSIKPATATSVSGRCDARSAEMPGTGAVGLLCQLAMAMAIAHGKKPQKALAAYGALNAAESAGDANSMVMPTTALVNSRYRLNAAVPQSLSIVRAYASTTATLHTVSGSEGSTIACVATFHKWRFVKKVCTGTIARCANTACGASVVATYDVGSSTARALATGVGAAAPVGSTAGATSAATGTTVAIAMSGSQ
mmetsp:Transcript_32502/g.100569  ORF Transcript_32502/g.100569 Transcript_32502/m.100569 type:complete len:200 (+) Transcript_32502:454-1053(+)